MTKFTQFSTVLLAVLWVHDQSATLITKLGTLRAEVSVVGESSSTLFSLSLMGLFLMSKFSASWCPRRRADPVLKSGTTSTQTSQQTSIPQRVMSTDSGLKSKILHVNEKCYTLNLSTKTQSFRGCLKCGPIQHRTPVAVEGRAGFPLMDTLVRLELLVVARWFNM